jgi:hypothetical protein
MEMLLLPEKCFEQQDEKNNHTMLYAGTISIKVLSTFHYVMPE